jgi:hypothetical protein
MALPLRHAQNLIVNTSSLPQDKPLAEIESALDTLLTADDGPRRKSRRLVGAVVRNPYMSATLSRPFLASVLSFVRPRRRAFFHPDPNAQ